MTERSLAFVFAITALMLPAARPAIISSLILTFALYSRVVPSCARSLPDLMVIIGLSSASALFLRLLVDLGC